jgi:hypothetical protein
LNYTDLIFYAASKDVPDSLSNELSLFLEQLGSSSAIRTAKLKRISARESLVAKIRRATLNVSRPRDSVMVSLNAGSSVNNSGGGGGGGVQILSTQVTKTMCVMINNVEMAKIKLADLDTELGGELETSLEGSFAILKQARDRLMGLVIFRVRQRQRREKKTKRRNNKYIYFFSFR